MPEVPRGPRPPCTRGGADSGERKTGDDSTVVTVTCKPQSDSCAQGACLVVINGIDLGRKYTLTQASTVIGRAAQADIRIEENATSRNHAVIENRGGYFAVCDLGSTNGTYVNDREVRESVLVDGDQIKIGRTILKFLAGSNIEAGYHDEIYRLTTIDGLTQVYNKRYFLKELQRELNRSLRHGRELSLILCDIDHFKATNDTYGHLAGDYILRQVAQLMRQHIRRDDIIARYGGEEFVLLLPELGKAKAAPLAEKLRELVASRTFEFDNVAVAVTLSMGIADLSEHRGTMARHGRGNDCFALIRLADERLYRAKQAGRNTVEAG